MNRKAILCIFDLLVIGMLHAYWVSFDGTPNPTPPSVEIISGNKDSLVLRISVHGVSVSDTAYNGQTYQMLGIPECAIVSDPGKPAVPMISRSIAIHPFKKLRLTIDSLEITSMNNFYIWPAQIPHTENEPPNPFFIDTSVYNHNAFYPGQNTNHTKPAIFRTLRVANINVSPIHFSPGLRTLQIIKKAIIKVDYATVDTANSLPNWPLSVSPKYSNLFQSCLFNYSTLGIETQYAPEKYLIIIAGNTFSSTLLPFITWKKKKGLDVYLEIIPSSFNYADYIKQRILYYYMLYDIDYVLLVGDGYGRDKMIPIAPPLIPYYDGREYGDPPNSYPYCDFWYSTIAGSDDIADVALGRFSVWTREQLATVINKTFAFERYPDESEWAITRHVLVSSWDGPPDSRIETIYHQCKIDSIAHPFLEPRNFIYFDDFGEWASNNDVKTHINNSGTLKGASIINYRGHGYYEPPTWNGWTSISPYSFYNSDIYELTNFVDKYHAWLPIVFEICCFCGRSHGELLNDDTTGHSECWFRQKNGGGVAALGATRGTDGNRNQKFDTELYRVSFSDTLIANTVQDLGWVINIAKKKTCDAYGWDFWALWNARSYHLIGDPEIDVYTAWNGYVTAVHSSQIFTGPQNYLVRVYKAGNVPLPNALVRLYKPNDVMQSLITDVNGEANFSIAPQTTGTMYVTVTKSNYGPYEGTCNIVLPPGGGQSQDNQPLLSLIAVKYDRSARSVAFSFIAQAYRNMKIDIYDVIGRLIFSKNYVLQHDGFESIQWNCHDQYGGKIADGIYFIRITARYSEIINKVLIY